MVVSNFQLSSTKATVKYKLLIQTLVSLNLPETLAAAKIEMTSITSPGIREKTSCFVIITLYCKSIFCMMQ